MEVILITVAVIIALAVLARSPMTRHSGDVAEQEMRAVAPGADVDRQFKRPRNEGGLF